MKLFCKKRKIHFTFVRYYIIMGLYSGQKGAYAVGEVIAVLSGKGGTGKTSVCAGLATALAETGASVLCVDCDVGLRNLDIPLGMASYGALSFQDVIRENYSLDMAAVHPDYPSLKFLTAPVECTADQIDPEAFRDFLRQAREAFSYVFLDAPAGAEAGFRLTAKYADRVILVTGPGPAAIRDAGRIGQILERMEKTDVRLVVNRLTAELVSALDITVDDIMDQAGLPLLGLVPEDPCVLLSAAVERPLLKTTRRGAAAACRRIAKRLLGQRVKIKL